MPIKNQELHLEGVIMSNSSKPKTLSEAIESLEKVASGSFSDQIEQLKNLYADYKPKAEEIEKKAKKAIEEKPFLSLGVAAVLFLLLGYILGKGNRR